MIRVAAIVGCALLLGACSTTSYKVAPTTAKIATKLETARRSTHEAQKRTAELATDTSRSQVEAKTTEGHIDAVIAAIGRQDYVTAAQEAVAAKLSNSVVMSLLEQSLRNIQSLTDSHKEIETDLGQALQEKDELQKRIDNMVKESAADHAIVERGRWAWGAGYIIVGVQELLTHAFWGALILSGVVLVVVVVGFIIGGPFLAGLKIGGSWLWGLIRKR